METETFQQILDTKKLRVPGFSANQPHMWKDVDGSWRGWLYEVSKSLAGDLGAELEIVETTWGNSIIELQQNRLDLILGTTPTPERLMVMDVSSGMYKTRLAVTARPGLAVETWEDLNKPEIKISCDVGTVHEHMARRLCPNAEIIALKSVEEAALAVRSRRADAHCIFWTSSRRSTLNDPGIGETIVPKPIFFSSSNIGMRRERDKTWRDFMNGWIDYARGAGIIQVAYLNAMQSIGIDPQEALQGIEF
ncbi:transporter substrate-binding domain-containing protein [Mesorhizobium sp. LHD-90]|uniref:transporter substrate-binding domain-containing protein n=1 Tax=Mesorhizobium sp. LHD-90 TaxID=3071414 RepID=UPI0027DEC46F|nr:transporter substrate-binding domain-containing protein [Mesorhizobium sp. LHD-90]MDQ6433215.1 transporter substrate-binding domain-containing protein [Mesorhizobium sp. LHD-90]